MLHLDITNKYKETLNKLHPNERKSLDNAVLLLANETPFHHSLRTKPIQGSKDIFEASANMDLRISWQYHDRYENTITIRNCGHHDDLLKKP